MAGAERKALQDKLGRAEARLKDLERNAAETWARVTVLRAQLATPPPLALYEIVPPQATAVRETTASDRIALFRWLFHGREDVFARLWVNAKKQRKGYAPACANE